MDIVERLRSVGGIEGTTRWYINPDGLEAADEIERLQKEKEIMADALRDANDYGMELAHEIERLREALEKLSCNCTSNCDWDFDGEICPSWVARSALKGDE